MKWAGTIGNGEDKDGAGLVGGGTTDAEEVEKRGDTIGDGGGGDAVGDVEDDDGVGGRANGPCGTGGGLLDGLASSLTLSVRCGALSSSFSSLGT
nr:hypothetical protein Iba_chr04aCG14580 [Ipomoea batatas]